MNSRLRMQLKHVLIASTALFLAQTTLAGDDSDCKKVRGDLSVINNGNGTTSGAITQGGRLNGTTQALFTSALTPTPDATTFSYTDNFTVTSNGGVLKTRNVGILDGAAGLFTEFARIDPSTSTGRFAGATGVLYVNGATTDNGATFKAEIAGEICFAK